MEKLKAYDLPVDQGDFTATVEQFYIKSEADKVLLHHARKRCLAMRHYCASRFSEWCTERRKKADFYWKWKEIWLSLAAEPTWQRFLQLIHKEAK